MTDVSASNNIKDAKKSVKQNQTSKPLISVIKNLTCPISRSRVRNTFF